MVTVTSWLPFWLAWIYDPLSPDWPRLCDGWWLRKEKHFIVWKHWRAKRNTMVRGCKREKEREHKTLSVISQGLPSVPFLLFFPFIHFSIWYYLTLHPFWSRAEEILRNISQPLKIERSLIYISLHLFNRFSFFLVCTYVETYVTIFKSELICMCSWCQKNDCLNENISQDDIFQQVNFRFKEISEGHWLKWFNVYWLTRRYSPVSAG